MGSRDFERATPNRIGTTATSHGSGMTGDVSFAAMLTIESFSAGAFHSILYLQSATTANQIGGGYSSVSNGWAATVGATDVFFAVASLPAPTGVWLVYAWTKTAGTQTPNGYVFNLSTGVMTGPVAAAATLGNRSAGVASINIGSFGAADYWDGMIARAMIVEKVLTIDQIQQLRFPGAWRQHLTSRNNLYVDLHACAPSTAFLEERSEIINLSSGTPAPVVGLAPSGW